MDYLEIMSFCGFDLEKANEMAQDFPPSVIQEVLTEIGLEKLESESRRSCGR